MRLRCVSATARLRPFLAISGPNQLFGAHGGRKISPFLFCSRCGAAAALPSAASGHLRPETVMGHAWDPKNSRRLFPHYHRASHSAAGSVVSWTAKINRAALRVGILSSAVGSVCGYVVQVKLGRLRCGAGGFVAWGAVIPLVTLVSSAMLIYIGIVFYAFTR